MNDERLKIKYSEFSIVSIIESLVDLYNVFEIERACKEGEFKSKIEETLTPMPSGVRLCAIYNKNNYFLRLYINSIGKIQFYKYNKKIDIIIFSTSHNLEKDKDYNIYYPTYIKDFIDYVIDYRIKNKRKEITKEEIKLLEKEYLKSKLNLIEEKFAKVQKEEEQKLEENNSKRENILKKIKE